MNVNLDTPTVSVVIPTYQRRREVIRAVASALNQTHRPLEVIVVNDGPDSEKREHLAQIHGNRVRFEEAPRRASPGATRNVGIRKAQGDWIALLDDDDVWLPDKLEAQLALAKRIGTPVVLFAMERVLWPDGSVTVRPHRGVRPYRGEGEPLSAERLLFDLGGINTSTTLAPTELFLRHPFDEKLAVYEDWQWLLDASVGLNCAVVPEVLVERDLSSQQDTHHRSGHYATAKHWYDRNQHRLARPTQARFVANVLSREAAYERDYRAILWLLAEKGRLSPLGLDSWVRLALPWLLRPEWRARLRRFQPNARVRK